MGEFVQWVCAVILNLIKLGFIMASVRLRNILYDVGSLKLLTFSVVCQNVHHH